MLVSVLASGSKGNATLIKTNKYNILVDAGMTCKYLESQLSEHGLRLRDIDYILITHTHIDHVNALTSLIKRAEPVIIMSEMMLADLKFLAAYPKVQILTEDILLGEVLIENVKTSHDASDSRGYIITENDSSVVIIMDTGYVNQKLWNKISNKSLYVFESNHNVEMLMHGRYPKWLKKRVGCPTGHLSNEASSFYLSRIIGPNTKQIILAHISQENNTPEIALQSIKSCFIENGIQFDNVIVAKQNEQTEGVAI